MQNHSFRAASTLAAVIFGLFLTAFFHTSISQAAAATDSSALARRFAAPPAQDRLYVWWHWMGLTISRHGIKRDLTAMKAAGVAGATICPIGSQAGVAADIANSGTKKPVKYWSPRFWRMVRYAVKTAAKLHLKLGMENCPGWDASGGPWITPALSMKMVTWSITTVTATGHVNMQLPQPPTQLGFYRDICVLALPQKAVVQPVDIHNISADMNAGGQLTWKAPAGGWRIYRIGYTSTASTDHPVPDSLVGPHGTVHSLEADKLSAAAAKFHIQHVIGAIQSHLGSAVGRTFDHLLFDSYEAGPQNWTKHFRRDFMQMRHYDPLPWLPVLSGAVIGSPALSARFRFDMARTVSQLFVKNDFNVYHKLIDAADMKMCLEPYTGPFNTIAAAASCDVTMGEFWNDSRDGIGADVAGAARADGRVIVGAETLTGGPATSRLTETPEFLKPALDGGFLSGVNFCYLHDWAHQALNKKYKPGILMGWWGTHFGENETWFKPGIAFFTYINRCQTMLRQGSQVCNVCTLNFTPPGFSVDALSLALFQTASVHHGKITLPDGRAYDVLLLPDSQQMLPRVAKKLKSLVAAGATVIGPRPTGSPSLTDYPACDSVVAAIGKKVWGDANGGTVKEHRFGKGLVVWNRSVGAVLAQLKIAPDFKLVTSTPGPLKIQSAIYAAPGFGRRVNVTAILRRQVRQDGGNRIVFGVNNDAFGGDPAFDHVKILTVHYTLEGRARSTRVTEGGTLAIPAQSVVAIHRHAPGLDIYFLVNRANQPVHVTASFLIAGKVPELWQPDTGRRIVDGEFTVSHGRTNVPLAFGPQGSLFVVFRRALTGLDSVVAVNRNSLPVTHASIQVHKTGQLRLWTARGGLYQLLFASGEKRMVRIAPLPKPELVDGSWYVSFTRGWGAPPQVVFPTLASWTQSPKVGIKYFSGTGTYRQSVTVPADFLGTGKRVILNLGSVKDMARVWVNGQYLGVLWHAPFKVDVTSALKVGVNHLRVAVTNTWRNRLIGDDQQPSSLQWGGMRTSGNTLVGRPLKRFPKWVINHSPRPNKGRLTFETWDYYVKGSRLSSAGLIGPVKLSVIADVPIPTPAKR